MVPAVLVTRRFTALNGTALLVGALAGLAAVLFRTLVSLIQNVAFEGEWAASPREPRTFLTSDLGVWVFLVPFMGGIFIGALRFLFPDLRRHGIVEVMAAVQARSGIVKARSAWGHAAVSALTVGTGGSTGREGPIGYIGATLGSSLGRHLGFGYRDIKVLLGCGTAAGIAATFNAPLGGVLFAMELILPEFSTHAFIPVVASTVIGVTVGHFFFGDQTTFAIPQEFTLVSPYELGLYLVLGVLCGLGGVGFIKLLGWASERGESLRIPHWTKPAVGGLFVGLLGLLVFELTAHSTALGGIGRYHVFGTGYGTVSAVLTGDATVLIIPLLFLLLVAKPIASSITIGSGGGGGVFSASLMQGALYGALLGLAANHFWPSATASPSAYAMVGMAAFYAATGRATLTTIVLLMELTGSRAIILPLMFAAVTADAVSVGLSRESIYTVRLVKKGITFDHDKVQSPLDFVRVREVMTRDVETLPGDISVGAAFDRMLDAGHNGFPVVDEEGGLIGVVTRRDLSRHLHEGRGDMRLSDVVSGLLITCYPEDRLFQARDRIFQQDIGRLIVVDPQDRRKLLGIVTRSDVLRAEAEKDVEHTDAWSRPEP